MGEMADDFLEYIEDAENERWNYRHGNISDEEAFELGLIDELGDDI